MLHLDRIGWNRILLKAGFALAGAAVEFPIVPGADDVFAVEAAFAQWSPDVIAGVRHHAELSVLEGNGKFARADHDASQWPRRQFFS